ncbi:MAG TPA: hypothetical protein VLA78_15015 [Paracoccaceae bacterium]|nr:hypothetical protein [Paracoccaceae bacterium]
MTRRRHTLLLVAFGLAVVLTLGFALRAGIAAWNLAQAQGQPVADWMTPRLVVRAYDVEPADLAAILNLEPGSAPRETLAQIAAAQGRPLAQLLAEVQALVDAPR